MVVRGASLYLCHLIDSSARVAPAHDLRSVPLIKSRLLFFLLLAFSARAAFGQFDLTPPSMTFEEEQAQADAQHPQIVAQSGGLVDNAKLSEYVSRVGQKVAKNSEMPNERFVFTTLNSSQVNAWTIGGGRVYITRGMLSVMNSEAELAAVLGHEVGHVTARHTARRETRMKWNKYQTGLLAILTGNPLLVSTKSVLDTTSGLSYSRRQESAADKLGFATIKQAGYDLDGMTDMLADLQRYVRLQSTMAGQDLEHQTPAWLSDHPTTDDRIQKATVRASLARVLAPNQNRDFADDYLRAVDGMIYGEDPKQGELRDGVFYHTGLKFAFDAPEQIKLQNTPVAIIGAKGDELVMLFGGEEFESGKNLQEFLGRLWQKVTDGSLGPIDSMEETEINGMPAIIAKKNVNVRTIVGSASIDLHTAVYRFNDESVAFMTFASEREDTANNLETIEVITNSFRRLSDDEVAEIKPKRVKIVDVEIKDTLATMADRMAFDDYRLARFKAINGFETHAELQRRPAVKIVTDGK